MDGDRLIHLTASAFSCRFFTLNDLGSFTPAYSPSASLLTLSQNEQMRLEVVQIARVWAEWMMTDSDGIFLCLCRYIHPSIRCLLVDLHLPSVSVLDQKVLVWCTGRLWFLLMAQFSCTSQNCMTYSSACPPRKSQPIKMCLMFNTELRGQDFATIFYCRLVRTRTLNADNRLTADVITYISITLYIIRTLRWAFDYCLFFFIGFISSIFFFFCNLLYSLF